MGVRSTALALALVAMILAVGERVSASEFDGVIRAMAGGAVGIGRDSGQEMTEEFLEGCRKNESVVSIELHCDDLVSTWHVSRLDGTGKRKLFAISVDGASVERRWVLEDVGGRLLDVTAEVWPNLSLQTVSERMIKATGDPKYSADFLLKVAHSPYRIEHPIAENRPIIVRSGVPDNTFGTMLGELRWNGSALEIR